jgi:hypothetical protein
MKMAALKDYTALYPRRLPSSFLTIYYHQAPTLTGAGVCPTLPVAKAAMMAILVNNVRGVTTSHLV